MRAGNGRARLRREDGGLREKGKGGALLSVRLCLSSALQTLHRSFHGKCTGTDYRRLERVSKRNGEGGGCCGVGAAGSGFVVRR